MKSIKNSCGSCKYWGSKLHKGIHEAYGPIHPHAKVCMLGFAHTEDSNIDMPSQRDYQENREFYESDEYVPHTSYYHKNYEVVTLANQLCEGYRPK